MENSSSLSLENKVGSVGVLENFLQKNPIVLQILKFGCIGVINTALDFIVLNLISKAFGVSSGTNLGIINILSFSLAMVQSYFWNKSWAFGEQDSGLQKNFFRLCVLGFLGFFGVVSVLYGARFLSAGPVFFSAVLTIFIILEIIIWQSFNLSLNSDPKQDAGKFGAFIVVSFIGLIINTLLVAVLSNVLSDSIGIFGNLDTVKNIAKILATFASLVWNFIGYKLIVFKK